MSAQPVPYLTVERYLEIERKAESKSEYFQGVMWPLGMAGARFEHNLVATNLVISLGTILRGRCRVFNSDMRIRVQRNGLYAYPDVSVVCGVPELADDRMTLLNPALVIEVLSESTELMDRGFKFSQYRNISTLSEYALVSPLKSVVEIFRRGNGTDDWTLENYTGLESSARFDSVDCTIALNEVFRDLELP